MHSVLNSHQNVQKVRLWKCEKLKNVLLHGWNYILVLGHDTKWRDSHNFPHHFFSVFAMPQQSNVCMHFHSKFTLIWLKSFEWKIVVDETRWNNFEGLIFLNLFALLLTKTAKRGQLFVQSFTLRPIQSPRGYFMANPVLHLKTKPFSVPFIYCTLL